MICTYFDHSIDITLWASKLSGIFDFDQDNEEQIMPHAVVERAMLLKRHGFVVER